MAKTKKTDSVVSKNESNADEKWVEVLLNLEYGKRYCINSDVGCKKREPLQPKKAMQIAHGGSKVSGQTSFQ